MTSDEFDWRLRTSFYGPFSLIKLKSPLQELELRRKMLGERLQRYHALNHMCNQSKRWAGRHGRVTSWPRCSRRQLSVTQQSSVRASVTIYESYLLSSNIESSSMSKAEAKHKGKSSSRYRLCVPPCPRYISRGDTHGLCVVCLGAKHAWTARFISGFHCVRFTPRRLFEEGAFPGVPRGAGPTVAEAERRLGSWESQMDQVEGMKTVEPLSSSFHQIQRPLSGTGSMSRGSSPLREASMLRLSSFEDMEDVGELS